MNIEDLAVQVKNGEGSIDELMKETASYVRLLFHETRDIETAEDHIQDTLFEVVKSWDRYDPSRSYKTWVAMLSQRKKIDKVRSVYRARKALGQVVSLYDPKTRETEKEIAMLQDQNDGPKEIAEQKSVFDTFYDALEFLPPERELPLVLSFVRGLSHTDIAGILDIPLGTVKSHIRKGLAAIREIYSERELSYESFANR
jgi:RNA polymerase sigma-70 factor (ECF subfamily)